MPDQGSQVDNIIINQMNVNKKEIRDDIAKIGDKVDAVMAENAKQNRRMDAHAREIKSNKDANERAFGEVATNRKVGLWIAGGLTLGMITIVGYVGGAAAVVEWVKKMLERIF